MDGRSELRGELSCILGTLVSPGPPVRFKEYGGSFKIDLSKENQIMQILIGSEGKQFYIQLVDGTIVDVIPT